MVRTASRSPSSAHTYLPRLPHDPDFHSLDHPHIYWSRQLGLFRWVTSVALVSPTNGVGGGHGNGFVCSCVHSSYSSEFQMFPGLWLAEQFLCICRQTTDQIELRFAKLLQFSGFWPFEHIFWQITDHVELRVGGWTDYGTPQAWLTLGHALLNFHNFLVSDLITQFVHICLSTAD